MVATTEAIKHRRISGEALHDEICVMEEIGPPPMQISPGEIGHLLSIACGANEVIAFWCDYAESPIMIARLLREDEYPDG